MIGYGGQFGGINAEERKRLSMAVELVAEPCILFLDEPTSGLGVVSFFFFFFLVVIPICHA